MRKLGAGQGTVHWSYYYGTDGTCDQSVTGTLDATGNLILNVAAEPSACGAYSDEYVLLNSGDMTSQGYLYCDPAYGSPPPLSNFPSNLGKEVCEDYPLIKSQTDLPSTESPSLIGWVAAFGSADPTFGAWERTLPLSSDGFVEFSGRFVFEQQAPGLSGADECYNAALEQVGYDPYPSFTAVTGGGWYVNTSGIWASGQALSGGTNLLNSDDIGISSDRVQWYQNNVGTCTITLYQAMFIDTSGAAGGVAYNTGEYGASNQLDIQLNLQNPDAPPPNICTRVTPAPTGSNQGPLGCKPYPMH